MPEKAPDLLHAFLADRDTPCPGCGYNLRGLPADRCPECNQVLTLRVGLAEPLVGPWLGALAAVLSGGGACLLCLVLVLIFSLRWGPPGGREFFAVVVLPIMGLFLQGTLSSLLMRSAGRKWFRALSPTGRRWTIAGCWLVPCIFVVWFAATVR